MLKITNSEIDPMQEIYNIADPIEALLKYREVAFLPRNKKEEKDWFMIPFMSLLSNVWNHYKWSWQIDEAIGQAINSYNWDQLFRILKSLKKRKNVKKISK